MVKWKGGLSFIGEVWLLFLFYVVFRGWTFIGFQDFDLSGAMVLYLCSILLQDMSARGEFSDSALFENLSLWIRGNAMYVERSQFGLGILFIWITLLLIEFATGQAKVLLDRKILRRRVMEVSIPWITLSNYSRNNNQNKIDILRRGKQLYVSNFKLL